MSNVNSRIAGYVVSLEQEIKDQQATIDKLIDGLRNVAGFLLCDGQDVEDVFNPSKKEITEQINIIRDLINSVKENDYEHNG